MSENAGKSLGLLGRKVGMTRIFTEAGDNVPVTVIEAGPCVVTQIKTPERDGYAAVQVGFESIKPRNSTFPLIGHDAKAGTAPKRRHLEFRVDAADLEGLELGQNVSVADFDSVLYVDIIGVSKGRGFAGPMRRHGFKGQLATHGVERKHRSPGSLGGRSSNAGTGKPKRGAKMSGQMGNVRVTARNLEVVARDAAKNLLLVKGAVPGANQGILEIRAARRLGRQKAAKAAAS